MFGWVKKVVQAPVKVVQKGAGVVERQLALSILRHVLKGVGVEGGTLSIFKSWKTTLAGVVVLATWLAAQGILPPRIADGVKSVVVGIGLILAKDSNQTGT